MKQEKIIKLLMSTLLGVIIDNTLSITDIFKQIIDPFIAGPFYPEGVKALLGVFPILIEITGIYQFLDKIKALNRVFK